MAHKILVIDDSRTIRGIITKQLKDGGLCDDCLEAGDGAEGLRIAAQQPVDLVLCDLDMPEIDGFEFLQRFRAENSRVPVLMLSGTGTTKKKVAGFAYGANDYIIKPCDADELCARVKNYLRLKTLQDQLERANEELAAKNRELAEIAITDALTGLYNRRHFVARAEEELKRSRRHNHSFGILMMDIDHFKRVNDTKGHPQGDVVLVTVAQALRAALRTTDLLSRFGGEEFVACVPETGPEHVRYVGERLRSSIAATPMPGLEWDVTLSIGISVFPAAHIDSVETLMRLADEALYRAKAAGRNRVEMAEWTAT